MLKLYQMLYVNAQIKIPDSEIEFRFARSGGPGGQKVNKVNTKAILVWSVDLSQGLSLEMKDYVAPRLGKFLNLKGEVVIQSDRFRSQERNKEDCLEKLKSLLLRASNKKKKRKKTNVPKSAKESRLKLKRKHAEKKYLRQRVNQD